MQHATINGRLAPQNTTKLRAPPALATVSTARVQPRRGFGTPAGAWIGSRRCGCPTRRSHLSQANNRAGGLELRAFPHGLPYERTSRWGRAAAGASGAHDWGISLVPHGRSRRVGLAETGRQSGPHVPAQSQFQFQFHVVPAVGRGQGCTCAAPNGPRGGLKVNGPPSADGSARDCDDVRGIYIRVVSSFLELPARMADAISRAAGLLHTICGRQRDLPLLPNLSGLAGS
jgi:hypothetical protein